MRGRRHSCMVKLALILIADGFLLSTEQHLRLAIHECSSLSLQKDGLSPHAKRPPMLRHISHHYQDGASSRAQISLPTIPNAIPLAIFSFGQDELLPPPTLPCGHHNNTVVASPS